MPSPHIDGLLMDIGNVLIKVDILPMEQYLLEQGAVISPEIKKDFYKLAATYEKGSISTEEFLDRSSQITQITDTDILIAAWDKIISPQSEIDATWDLCRKAKKTGLRLTLFSNTNALHTARLKMLYPELFTLFDTAILSHEIGDAKPQPAMYQYAIHETGLIPEKTLYLDDKEENISAGRQFGFQVHIFDYRKPETFVRFPL